MAENNEFNFINEKRKKKPLDRRRILQLGGLTVVFAAIFGFIACLVFTCFEPVMEEWLSKDEKITIPDTPDNEEEEDTTEEKVYVTETQELELEDYQLLQSKLYKVGTQMNTAIVTVTGTTSDTDWFNTPYESAGEASGIIIAENSRELLILSEKRIIADASAIQITFSNGESVDGSLKDYDGNTGIAIISVSADAITEDTREEITTATLGNSRNIVQGSVVIAVGSPLGTNYSVLTGIVTSSENEISTIDTNYSVFSTDIVASANGSGALINLNGEVIGFIMQDFSSNSDTSTLTAVPISEVKKLIETLSNGQAVPYLGLKLTTITEEIAEQYDIPKGVYVKNVELDSPAMEAGLQSGDVIVEINGEDVSTAEGYTKMLYASNIGDTFTITVKRQSSEEYKEIECSAELSVLK